MTHTLHPIALSDVCVVFKDGKLVVRYGNPHISPSSRAVPLVESIAGVVKMGHNIVSAAEEDAPAPLVPVLMAVNNGSSFPGPDWAEAMRNGCIPIHVLPEQCTRDDELLPSNCCLADIVRRRDMLWSGHLVLQVVDGPILCLLYGSYSGSRGWWCTCV